MGESGIEFGRVYPLGWRTQLANGNTCSGCRSTRDASHRRILEAKQPRLVVSVPHCHQPSRLAFVSSLPPFRFEKERNHVRTKSFITRRSREVLPIANRLSAVSVHRLPMVRPRCRGCFFEPPPISPRKIFNQRGRSKVYFRRS